MKRLLICARVELFLFIFGAIILNAQHVSKIVRQYKEIDTLFANANKGWLTSQYLPHAEPRFQSSLAYWRFDWNQLEPEKDQYNWKIIDTALNEWSKKGMKFAFRIMTANPHSQGYYSSPQWLFNKGCRKFEYSQGDNGAYGGKNILRVEPDYSDSIFLQQHENFIFELGKRYDGNPNIEFIDIGSFGLWGEWHTPHDVSFDIKKKIIDMYTGAFKKTPLIMMTADPEGLRYAADLGLGARRDGVGSVWDIASWNNKTTYPKLFNTQIWKTAPVVFEWYANYDYLSHCDHCSFDAGFQFMLDNHVTYINDNIGQVPDSILSRLRILGEKSGYRFVMNEISHLSQVRSGDTLPISMDWSNVGVAPLYEEHYLYLSLTDPNGKTVFSQKSHQNINQWLPGNYHVDEKIAVPATLPPAKYTICVSMVNAKTQQADICFPINVLGMNGFYSVSSVIVK